MEFIDLKMKKAQAPFGFTLLNIPIINLWKEFEAHLRLGMPLGTLPYFSIFRPLGRRLIDAGR